MSALFSIIVSKIHDFIQIQQIMHSKYHKKHNVFVIPYHHSSTQLRISIVSESFPRQNDSRPCRLSRNSVSEFI